MSTPPDPPSAHPVPAWLDARLLEIRGGTAADFLQGYLTCDTLRINAASAIPMAICNVKGRVLASGWAVKLDEGIGLIVHASLAEAVAQFLKPYVTFSKCTLVVREDACLSISETSPGIELQPGLYLSVIGTPEQTTDASQQMTDAFVGSDFAFVSAAVSEKFLPQMLGLDAAGAVDFDKGCYLGQEIVARATFRGAVKRKLVRFQWHGDKPAIGSEMQDVGTVIDVSATGNGLALGKT